MQCSAIRPQMTPNKKVRLSNVQTVITIEFAKHTIEVTSLFSVLGSVLTLGAVVLIWPLVTVYSGISNSSVLVCSVVTGSVCSVVSVSVVCMVVYSTVVKSVVCVSMCSAVVNVHSIVSVNGGDSAWQNSVPTATPAE